MIRALPQQRNRVIVSNAARNQQFLGVNWHGTLTRPSFALVRIQTGEKPMPVQGYDLLGHEGRHAAYGDRKLLRHAMDSGIDQANELLFPSLVPTMGAGLLALWLVRKSGEQLTYADTLKIKELILEQPELLHSAPHSQPVGRLDEVKAVKQLVVKHGFEHHPAEARASGP